MPFDVTISPELACSVISAVGVALSAFVSKRTAETIANKETEKMKLKWEREDVVSSDEEFAAMVDAAAKTIAYPNSENYFIAIGRIAAIRSKEIGTLGHFMDELYKAIRNRDYEKADEWLTKIIKQKRLMKSPPSADDR